MTKTLTQKEQVAVFVRYQPNCAVDDVSEAQDLAGGTVGRLLRELCDDGVIIRSRDSVQYKYSSVPHADIPDVILPCMVEKVIQLGCMLQSRKRRHLRKKKPVAKSAVVYSSFFDLVGSDFEVACIAKLHKYYQSPSGICETKNHNEL